MQLDNCEVSQVNICANFKKLPQGVPDHFYENEASN